VADLISTLGLSDRADTRIGATGHEKVLSGGEKKRLAFASELLTDPPLLFCDEPTTGLDSFSAQKIVHMMSNMASQGKTIVCTIHQPSSELFSQFHELILLVDGRIAFMGAPNNAVTFFERSDILSIYFLFSSLQFYSKNMYQISKTTHLSIN
jgi:ATP-binding cassette, subfamily G (WHITE), eye pigment precursor transporter